jgi:hypothetical protein
MDVKVAEKVGFVVIDTSAYTTQVSQYDPRLANASIVLTCPPAATAAPPMPLVASDADSVPPNSVLRKLAIKSAPPPEWYEGNESQPF